MLSHPNINGTLQNKIGICEWLESPPNNKKTKNPKINIGFRNSGKGLVLLKGRFTVIASFQTKGYICFMFSHKFIL
jgi:hypothetical protein